MVGKNGIFRGNSFEKSVFQKIPRKKMYEKSAPGHPAHQGDQIGRFFDRWVIALSNFWESQKLSTFLATPFHC
jgi:hypothetical protein